MTVLITHHTSYYPEETIDVCRECHGKIHDQDGFHDDLIPERDRPRNYGTQTDKPDRDFGRIEHLGDFGQIEHQELSQHRNKALRTCEPGHHDIVNMTNKCIHCGYSAAQLKEMGILR